MRDTLILLECGNVPELEYFMFGIRESFVARGFGKCRFTLREPIQTTNELDSLFTTFVEGALTAADGVLRDTFIYAAPGVMTLSEGKEEFRLAFAMSSVLSKHRMTGLSLEACGEYPKIFGHSVATLGAGMVRRKPIVQATSEERREAERLIQTVQTGFQCAYTLMVDRHADKIH